MSKVLGEIIRSRFIRAALALAVCGAGAGCTAGGVNIDGWSIHPHSEYQYVVLFLPKYPTGGTEIYASWVTWGAPNHQGMATFSFDPNVAATSFTGFYAPSNDSVSIPEGEYVAQVVVYQNNEGVAVFTSQPFQHSYPSTLSIDDYNGEKTPAQIYDLEVAPFSTDCPGSVNNGSYVTLTLCQGGQAGQDFPPLSTYF